MEKLTCFKAYDIRGQLGEELNADIAYRIGRAYGQFLHINNTKEKTVVVGGDVRLTSEELKLSLAQGIMDAGVNVLDIGLCGTEEIYFATFHLELDGGVEVTASHNPMNYNGMKLVREDAKPISGDTGLHDIQEIAEHRHFVEPISKGQCKTISVLNEYIDHLMGYIQAENIKPLRLVVNSGNGAAGHVIDALEARFTQLNIPLELIKVHHNPDGTFPNGIPNPLLPECRDVTSNAVKEYKADMGIAFDGDFDRCFFFDEKGEFIEGYYIVGLLAEAFLQKEPGAKIVHDPRLTWNTIDIVEKAGGIPIMSKTGHAFIKERMRKEDAIYGGEMSAHHYFRDFAYCDSGMIPWLLVAELLSVKNMTLSETIKERIRLFPCSGEINYKVNNSQSIIDDIEHGYKDEALNIDRTDGFSLEMKTWRLNIRSSNTEPVLRLNIESQNNPLLVNEKVREIENRMKSVEYS